MWRVREFLDIATHILFINGAVYQRFLYTAINTIDSLAGSLYLSIVFLSLIPSVPLTRLKERASQATSLLCVSRFFYLNRVIKGPQGQRERHTIKIEETGH